MPYFIRDFNGVVRGNPKGYATHSGACKALAQKHKFTDGLTLRHWLWDYQEKNQTDRSNTLIYSIK